MVHTDMDRVFKPKVEWVFWSHFGLVLAAFIAMSALSLLLSSLLLLLITLVFLVFVVYGILLVKRTSYTLKDDSIMIQKAIVRYDIPYASMKKIVDTDRDPLNYGIFVLSLDRIRITYGETGHALISPKDKQEVLRVLKERCPNAVYREDLRSGR